MKSYPQPPLPRLRNSPRVKADRIKKSVIAVSIMNKNGTVRRKGVRDSGNHTGELDALPKLLSYKYRIWFYPFPEQAGSPLKDRLGSLVSPSRLPWIPPQLRSTMIVQSAQRALTRSLSLDVPRSRSKGTLPRSLSKEMPDKPRL